jgi:hypothetical protein
VEVEIFPTGIVFSRPESSSAASERQFNWRRATHATEPGAHPLRQIRADFTERIAP